MSYAHFLERLEGARKNGDPLTDFRNVVYRAFKFLPGSPEPTPMQYDYADFLANGPDRLIGQVFRGFGKSTVASMLPPWAWLFDPDLKFLSLSGEHGLAVQYSSFVLNMLRDIPLFQHLYPTASQRSSAQEFFVNGAKPHRDASLKSTGILGRMTGSHADWIIADDVEVPNTSDTTGMREKLVRRYEEVEAVLNPGGRITVLGTPQTEETIYRRLNNQGYELRVYPVVVPGGPGRPTMERYKGVLAPYIRERVERGELKVDEPTDPRRLGPADILKKETLYRKAGFDLQFMLDPSETDNARRPLHLSDLIVADVDSKGSRERLVWGSARDLVREDVPNLGVWGDRYHRPALEQGEFKEWGGTVMWVDPAGGGHDETAFAVVSFLNGTLYLRDWGGRVEDGTSEDVMEWLAQKAKENKVNEVVVEQNFGEGMYAKLLGVHLRRIHPVRLESFRNTGNKAKRILDALQAPMQQHRLVVSATALRDEADWARRQGIEELHRTLAYQISRMTPDGKDLEFDDRIEAVACAVRHFANVLDVDAVEAMQRNEEEEEERWLEEGAPMLPPKGERPGSRPMWIKNRAIPS